MKKQRRMLVGYQFSSSNWGAGLIGIQKTYQWNTISCIWLFKNPKINAISLIGIIIIIIIILIEDYLIVFEISPSIHPVQVSLHRFNEPVSDYQFYPNNSVVGSEWCGCCEVINRADCQCTNGQLFLFYFSFIISLLSGLGHQIR